MSRWSRAGLADSDSGAFVRSGWRQLGGLLAPLSQAAERPNNSAGVTGRNQAHLTFPM